MIECNAGFVIALGQYARSNVSDEVRTSIQHHGEAFAQEETLASFTFLSQIDAEMILYDFAKHVLPSVQLR